MPIEPRQRQALPESLQLSQSITPGTPTGSVGHSGSVTTFTTTSGVATKVAYFDPTGGRLFAPHATGVISPPAVVELLASNISLAAPSVLSTATSLVGLAAP